MHPPWQKGAGLKKIMALVARFQKLRGWGLLSQTGRLNFQKGRGELNFQRRLDSPSLPYFSANVLFLWQHCY